MITNFEIDGHAIATGTVYKFIQVYDNCTHVLYLASPISGYPYLYPACGDVEYCSDLISRVEGLMKLFLDKITPLYSKLPYTTVRESSIAMAFVIIFNELADNEWHMQESFDCYEMYGIFGVDEDD